MFETVKKIRKWFGPKESDSKKSQEVVPYGKQSKYNPVKEKFLGVIPLSASASDFNRLQRELREDIQNITTQQIKDTLEHGRLHKEIEFVVKQHLEEVKISCTLVGKLKDDSDALFDWRDRITARFGKMLALLSGIIDTITSIKHLKKVDIIWQDNERLKTQIGEIKAQLHQVREDAQKATQATERRMKLFEQNLMEAEEAILKLKLQIADNERHGAKRIKIAYVIAGIALSLACMQVFFFLVYCFMT